MGDEGKLYVPEELVHVYREKVKRALKEISDCVLSIVQLILLPFSQYKQFI